MSSRNVNKVSARAAFHATVSPPVAECAGSGRLQTTYRTCPVCARSIGATRNGFTNGHKDAR